jgi:hypothetical protein
MKTHISKHVLSALKEVKANGGTNLDEDSKISLRTLDFALDTDDNAAPMKLTESGELAITNAVTHKEDSDMATKKGKKSKPVSKASIGHRDGVMTKKYKHFVAGSLRAKSGSSKLQCEIKCLAGAPGLVKKSPGCTGERTVFSSDVFQVKVCEACRDFREPKVKAAPKKKSERARVTINKATAAKRKAKSPVRTLSADSQESEAPVEKTSEAAAE